MASINDFKISLNNLKKIDINKALTKSCVLVETTAKELCPAETGYLRRSITFEVEGNKGRVGTNVSYAPYVHEGTGLFAFNGDGRKTPWRYKTADGQWHTTSGMSPHPFLRDALNNSKADIIKIFKDSIKK